MLGVVVCDGTYIIETCFLIFTIIISSKTSVLPTEQIPDAINVAGREENQEVYIYTFAGHRVIR